MQFIKEHSLPRQVVTARGLRVQEVFGHCSRAHGVSPGVSCAGPGPNHPAQSIL